MSCAGNVEARATTRFLWWTLHFTRDAAVAHCCPVATEGWAGGRVPGCRSQASGGGARFSMCEVSIRDVLLDVPDVLLDVVDVLRDAGVRFPVLGAHVIYAPVPFTSALHHAGERNSGDLEHGFRRSGMLVGA